MLRAKALCREVSGGGRKKQHVLKPETPKWKPSKQNDRNRRTMYITYVAGSRHVFVSRFGGFVFLFRWFRYFVSGVSF